jgi:hypothetical protein
VISLCLSVISCFCNRTPLSHVRSGQGKHSKCRDQLTLHHISLDGSGILCVDLSQDEQVISIQIVDGCNYEIKTMITRIMQQESCRDIIIIDKNI